MNYAFTGDEEEEGYPDEYQLEELDIGASDYVKQEGVPDFRGTWEELGEESEMADSYGLGQRDSLQEAVEAVIAILGMQVCHVGLLNPETTPLSTYTMPVWLASGS